MKIERTNTLGILRYSTDYLEAYRIIVNNQPNILKLFSVKYFLLSRTIELCLKGLLKTSGMEIKKIKNNYGHDLEKLANKASEAKLINLATKENAIIKSVNAYYIDKQFEYSKIGYKELPKLKDLEDLATKLLEKLKTTINASNFG